MSLRPLVLVVPEQKGKHPERKVVIVPVGATEECEECNSQEVVDKIMRFFHNYKLYVSIRE